MELKGYFYYLLTRFTEPGIHYMELKGKNHLALAAAALYIESITWS